MSPVRSVTCLSGHSRFPAPYYAQKGALKVADRSPPAYPVVKATWPRCFPVGMRSLTKYSLWDATAKARRARDLWKLCEGVQQRTRQALLVGRQAATTRRFLQCYGRLHVNAIQRRVLVDTGRCEGRIEYYLLATRN